MSDYYYNDTIRLARLIGLDHVADDVIVWRTDQPYHRMPWWPFERNADLRPIREWLAEHHPYWLRGWDAAAKLEARLRTVARDEIPGMLCRAVLDTFDPPDPNQLTPGECEVALAELAERLEGAVCASQLYIGEIQRLTRDRDKWAANAMDYMSERNTMRDQAVKIERLRAALDERTQQHATQLDDVVRLTREVERLRARNRHCIESSWQRLRDDLTTARATNRRLNRRCQAAERMEREYKHAANYFRCVGQRIEEQADTVSWWLERLRETVKAAEAAEREG